MLNVTLKRSDTIEDILPALETAMQTGDVCRVANIDYLDLFEIATLRLMVGVGQLFDAASGMEHYARSGFRLIGVDSCGEEHSLT